MLRTSLPRKNTESNSSSSFKRLKLGFFHGINFETRIWMNFSILKIQLLLLSSTTKSQNTIFVCQIREEFSGIFSNSFFETVLNYFTWIIHSFFIQNKHFLWETMDERSNEPHCNNYLLLSVDLLYIFALENHLYETFTNSNCYFFPIFYPSQ